MSARIVHFGDDRFNRLGPLRDAGYSIEACTTLEELLGALDSDAPPDALTIAETDDLPLDEVLAIARSRSSVPLIIFRGSTRPLNRSEFNLVVPLLAQPRLMAARDRRSYRAEPCHAFQIGKTAETSA